MSLLDEIERSRKGETITIPFHHDKLSRYIFLGKGLYHLIGGAGGSGKSAWVDLNYVIGPAMWYKKTGQFLDSDLSLKIILRSLERSKERRKAKWVCMKLYLDHGILIDTATMLGWGQQKNRVTDELYELIVKAYDWVEQLLDIVEIVDGVENPTGIFKHYQNYALSVGTLYKYHKPKGATEEKLFKITKDDEVPVVPEACPEATPYQPHYIPDNEKHITLGVTDHMQAMKRERGYKDKENLDKMSEYFRIMRDLYQQTPVAVNQMNRNISSTYRRVKTNLMPEDKDFSGSSMMFNDCDMAGILFNPHKYKVNDVLGWIPSHCINNYGINRFRSFHLLKNTYGPDNQVFAYQFIGENGIFREIPTPDEMEELPDETKTIYNEIANPPYDKLLVKYTKDTE